mmetsp:Transcript_13866/g.23065  ORF Transcript_13866/g.23065 Transcript_13866/m.23065 type:complete len:403 (-) Transcript_13866:505-1713(-)|eukprot:CAMPEP_0181042392 /NCGR_PEP_ID=MMETSP1070-20121207/12126_1 /TAXON_ID=265543 /ORGANISM="Minutocellus polymorphus, Strain NH13" /LENGTH=402 /DNA_ID=CAMNT_0023120603 /DNA_START=258 /DNA_END=1466 /DNA_ORIENTATION=-
MTHSALQPLFDIIDAIVELYLQFVIKPFLEFHDVFYASLNKFCRSQLDNAKKVPVWFTANFITYLRTALIIPTLCMLSWRWWVPVSLTIIFVDFGDFLDGVVARYWVDKKKEEKAKKDEAKAKVGSDDDSFEVVSIGRPQKIASWSSNCRDKSYGGFVDAVCDKAYVVPCWIFFLSTIPGTRLRMLQYVTLWCLILAEAASGTVRFRAYFTAQGVQAPRVVGLDFSTSAVKADGIGKAKQTMEMVGSALYALPWLRYPGLLLLSLAVPLAYESVRRKIKKRVIYIDGADQGGNVACHKTLKFRMQARGMGSKLIVGVVGKEKTTDMVLNACACSAVDEVIAEAPEKVDLDFLTTHGIDYVLCSAGKAKDIAHDELVAERRILQLHEDGAARPIDVKSGAKTE